MEEHNGYKETTEIISLVQAAAEGDQGAFKRLHDKYTQSLDWLLLNILKNPEDVKDATQDTWLRAYHDLSKYNPNTAKFKTFLYTIAMRVAKDKLRYKYAGKRDERRTTSLDRFIAQDEDGSELTLIETLTGSTLTPEEVMEGKILKDATSTILGKLGIGGQMLRLYYYEDLTIEEIATVFDTTKGTVLVRMSKARREFREIALNKFRDIFDCFA